MVRSAVKVIFLLLPASICSWAGTVVYSVTEVPLTGVYGLNSSNQVVGDYGGYAAVWSLAGNAVTVLPVPAGATNDGGAAMAIDSSGQVVGEYNNGSSYLPFFYDPAGGSTNINVPLDLQSTAYSFTSLNDGGTFVGSTYGGSLFTGTASGLQPLSGPGASAAYGINNAGTVAGTGVQCDPTNTYCQPTALIYPNSLISQVGYGAPFYASEAVAINSRGRVIGNADQNGAYLTNQYVFEYDPVSDSLVYLSQDYFGTHRGTLVGVGPGGINDAGDIVGQGTAGTASTPGCDASGIDPYNGRVCQPTGAISYGGTASVSLTDLVDPNWDITNAYSINNAGGILAYGVDYDPSNSYSGYVLLEPSGVPEPSTALGLLAGLATLVTLRRRR